MHRSRHDTAPPFAEPAGPRYHRGMGTHDHPYKLLFSHPEMVRDLLLTFVDENWVKDLDFSTLQRRPNSFVSDDLQEVDAMLSETVIEWTKQWKEEGLAAGRAEGLAAGKAEGRAEGRREAVEEVTRKLLAHGMPIEEVAAITGLSVAEIEQLKPHLVSEPAAPFATKKPARKPAAVGRSQGPGRQT